MIFVTVGTHEQPFDRLLQCVDELKARGTLTEEVVLQTGVSTYIPKSCQWERFYPYQTMQELVEAARIVVTHGGPSSFLMALQRNKVPVVVPRMHKFGEHVNDHQLTFCKEVADRNKNILLVEDVSSLEEVLLGYDTLAQEHSAEMQSNNTMFNKRIQEIVSELL